jgi:di/tricarboxylate transporter
MVLEMVIVLAIIVLALVLFVTEWASPDMTALLVMALLMVTQILTPAEGISGFSNSATLTILAMFILSSGIVRTGLVNRITYRILAIAGRSQYKQLILITAVVGSISGFINDTAAVVILLPLVLAVARDTRSSPSKLLIPLSYAALLGGTLTLIGTSTNLLVSGLLEEFGFEGLSVFSFTHVGIFVLLIGMIYLWTVGYRLLPERIKPEAEAGAFEVGDFLCEVKVLENYPYVNEPVSKTVIHRVLGVDILQILRGEETIYPPLDWEVLSVGDILVLGATPDEVDRVGKIKGLDLVPELDVDCLALTTEDVVLVEAVVAPRSAFIGRTLTQVDMHGQHSAQVVAYRPTMTTLKQLTSKGKPPVRMRHHPLQVGDLLLLQVSKKNLQTLARNRSLILGERVPLETYRTKRMPIALGIMAGVVAIAAGGWFPIVVTALFGAVLMVLTGCLKVEEVYTAVEWRVIFILGGLIPLGIAMVKTGAADLVGGSIASLATYVPPIGILIFFSLTTVLLTGVMSNNASVLIMVPVSLSTAASLGLNPLTFALAVMFAGSASFMTPVGYQTNILVWKAGGYKFTDYLKVGGPLNLLLAVFTPFLLTIFFPL